MKKIIKNKLYDTNTAKALAARTGDNEEILYQKRTGEYFLCTDGATIRPMSYLAAQEWASLFLTDARFDELFGATADDYSLVSVPLKIRARDAAQFKREAARRAITQAALLTELIRSM